MSRYRIVGRILHNHYNDRGGCWLIVGPDGKRVAHAESLLAAKRLLGSLNGRAARAAKARARAAQKAA